uniref:Glucosamine/galactosamine-6-phosphate isomerase domain-containing protein n=1 Tax=Junco hyemalis TaxID=40217 RepID=A0A8C5IGL6_JUNHY
MAAVSVFPSPGELGAALARSVAEAAAEAVASGGRFTLGLSGGSLVQLLARELPPALSAVAGSEPSRWLVAFCDERLVPPEHPESTGGAYRAQLLSQLAAPPQVLWVRSELGPAEAAREYEGRLRQVLGELGALGMGTGNGDWENWEHWEGDWEGVGAQGMGLGAAETGTGHTGSTGNGDWEWGLGELIQTGPYRSELVRTGPNWSILAYINPDWSVLVQTGPNSSVLVHIDLNYSILVHTGPYWSKLVHTGPNWSILIHTDLY